jgi:hypothetical protein
MGEVMTHIGWTLADLATQLLEPRERDAVRGDLAECGASGWCAFRQVLGLVLRRQAALWNEWQPWFAVIAIVLPIGLILSHATRWWADANALDVLIYWRLWNFEYLDFPGWRRNIELLMWWATMSGMALAGWSWTSGYVVASLSRRTGWVTFGLFAMIVFLGTLGTATVARTNATAFAGHFLGIVFPRLVRFLLVLLPALWGMHCSRRASASRGMLALGCVSLIAVTLLVAPGLELSLTLGRGVYPSSAVIGPDKTAGTADDQRPLWPISLFMLWPTAAILSSTLWRREPVSSSR